MQLKRQINKKILTILAGAFFVSLFVFIFVYFDPVSFVNNIGIQNAYILAFTISLFGGLSAAGSASFIAILTTLVLGGVSPVLLGIIAGVGLSIGDMFIFFLGSKGRSYVEGVVDARINRWASIVYSNKILKACMPIMIYVYMALTPLPNDIILIFLSSIKYPKNKTRVIIVLADLTFAILLTLFTAKGLHLFI